jgi:hypothetical protein
MPLCALVAVRGHPFDRTAFDAMFQAMEGVSATMVDQPAAALLMNPDGMRDFGALVLYDMPGLDFEADARPPSSIPRPPCRSASAPCWNRARVCWRSIMRWPDGRHGAIITNGWVDNSSIALPMCGADRLDSGYRHDVAYQASVMPHPITAGLPASFAMQDELYLAEVFTDLVEPLMTSDADFTRDHFWSADLAVRGQMFCRDGWDHPPGSSLIGWTKMAINSRLAYLQPGDGVAAYDNPHYRRLVENALRWVAGQ